MKRIDPVHEENGKWYYWLETWADRHGPYETEEIAREELSNYCLFLNFGAEAEADARRMREEDKE